MEKGLSDNENQEIQPSNGWIEIVNHFIFADAVRMTPEFCGHEKTEDLLEDKLWEFALGHMGEEKKANFWEKIEDCLYCLTTLKRMIDSLSLVEQTPSCPLERIEKIIQKKNREAMAKNLLW